MSGLGPSLIRNSSFLTISTGIVRNSGDYQVFAIVVDLAGADKTP